MMISRSDTGELVPSNGNFECFQKGDCLISESKTNKVDSECEISE